MAAALLPGAPPAATEGQEPGAVTPQEALGEGNHHFRGGDLEAALAAYERGWDPEDPDPVLAYNLGVTAHHLRRLPEAVLWYRRAERDLPEDRWLAENLALARERLGTEPPPAPTLLARAALHRGELETAAALLAWISLALALVARRGPRGAGPLLSPVRLAIAVAGLALGLFLLARLLPLAAARPAVLLAPCDGGEVSLPAGSEVWVRDREADGWEIEASGAGGEEPTCRAETAALVWPASWPASERSGRPVTPRR